MSLTNKSGVKAALRGYVELVRICRVIARTEAYRFAINLYARLPTVAISLHSKKSANAARSSSIVRINFVWDIAEICKSVIGAISVYMVNLMFWPFARYVEPRESVFRVLAPIDANCTVSGNPPFPANAIPCLAISRRNDARKNSSFGVVVKNLAQTLRGKIGLSHDALLMLIGQRPACVGSTCGLRYFSAGRAK